MEKSHSIIGPILTGAIALLPLVASRSAIAQSNTARPIDLQSDTWVATDALGRNISVAPRPPRADRFVGIFYFMTQGTKARHDQTDPVPDNSRILKMLDGRLGPQYPAYMHAYQHGGDYWWGQPAGGYFLSDDVWVHRKNLIMLGDAGVDVIMLDATNAVLYPAAEHALLEAASQLQKAGRRVPKIGYVVHANVPDTVARIYKRFYTSGKYRSLWFNWLGKPLIMGDENALTKDKKPVSEKLKKFFTWRDSWAWTKSQAWFGNGRDKWPWLDNYPQGYGWHDNKNIPEEVAVSIAGHPTTDIGRSYVGYRHGGGKEPPLSPTLLAANTAKGTYFNQQWHRALKLDPKFIFVTGWNEWGATRFPQKPPYHETNAGLHLPCFFVDEFNAEFSRDAMPMKGGYQDNYYWQLVEGIRKFKGARNPPQAHHLHTIKLAGSFAQWNAVKPDYLHGLGDDGARDWPGWGKHYYRVPAKRNSIDLAKVACDQQYIAFYVHTEKPLSSSQDSNWMQLLLNTDQNPATGWHGYDFVINRHRPGLGMTSVERYTNGTWKTMGDARLRVQGNQMMILVPRRLLLMPTGHGTALDFHWLDDVPIPSDPANFWYQGESAPDGRFNYRYANIGD